MSDEDTHDPCGPSQLKKRRLCPGSYAAELGLPNHSSLFAQEGSDLHDMVADLLRKKRDGVIDRPDWTALAEVALPRLGQQIDRYQLGCVKACYYRAQEVIGKLPGCQVFIEEPLDLGHLLIELGGTGDFCAATDDYVAALDWKFGYNPVDHASRNEQGWAYLSGWMRRFPGRKLYGFGFYQPRQPEGNSFHWFKPGQMPRLEDSIRITVRVAKAKDAPRIAGAEQCRYCSALITCPTAQAEIDWAEGVLNRVP